MKIMVVENDPALRKLIRVNLEARSYTTCGAINGIQALYTLAGQEEGEEESPDLIIMNECLPDLDVLDLCRFLRVERAIPLIVLSPTHDEMFRREFASMGVNGYLPLPFDIGDLMALVNAVLPERRRLGVLGV